LTRTYRKLKPPGRLNCRSIPLGDWIQIQAILQVLLHPFKINYTGKLGFPFQLFHVIQEFMHLPVRLNGKFNIGVLIFVDKTKLACECV